MLDVLKFIFSQILEFIKMLFSIDVGFTNLGALMCIVYIFLPSVLIIVNFFKRQFIDEFDDWYDNRNVKKYRGKHEKR